MVVVVSNHGWRFGGYAANSWSSYGGYYGSGDSFLFTLSNPSGIPLTKYNQKRDGYQLHGTAEHGPTFGGGMIFI